MHYLIFVLVFAFVDLISAVKVDFNNCGGNVQEVRIFGCKDDALPCIMEREQEAKLEFDFKAPFDSDYVYIDVYPIKSDSYWSRLSPILSAFDRNACNGHGLNCPIRNNKIYSYNYSMYLDKNLPAHKGEYQVKLSSFWGYTIACFEVPIELI